MVLGLWNAISHVVRQQKLASRYFFIFPLAAASWKAAKEQKGKRFCNKLVLTLVQDEILGQMLMHGKDYHVSKPTISGHGSGTLVNPFLVHSYRYCEDAILPHSTSVLGATCHSSPFLSRLVKMKRDWSLKKCLHPKQYRSFHSTEVGVGQMHVSR